VDAYKTELIADRVWRNRAQLELATVEWFAWLNHDRLHESLGEIPPIEFEQLHASSSPGAISAAPNGTRSTALALPPMEMISDGQPPDAQPRTNAIAGLPTGLNNTHVNDEEPPT